MLTVNSNRPALFRASRIGDPNFSPRILAGLAARVDFTPTAGASSSVKCAHPAHRELSAANPAGARGSASRRNTTR
jgi:hypothetical protein